MSLATDPDRTLARVVRWDGRVETLQPDGCTRTLFAGTVTLTARDGAVLSRVFPASLLDRTEVRPDLRAWRCQPLAGSSGQAVRERELAALAF